MLASLLCHGAPEVVLSMLFTDCGRDFICASAALTFEFAGLGLPFSVPLFPAIVILGLDLLWYSLKKKQLLEEMTRPNQTVQHRVYNSPLNF